MTGSLAAINATLADASGLLYTGNFNYVGADSIGVEADDGGQTGAGGVQTTAIAVSVTVAGDERDVWRNESFSEAVLSDPSLESTVWGDLANPDGDSLVNLLEYALGGDPADNADGATLITRSIGEDAGSPGDRLHSMTFTRRTGDSDLAYFPEVSDDGETWLSDAANVVQVGDAQPAGAGLESVVFQDLTPVTPGNPRYFRLRVTRD